MLGAALLHLFMLHSDNMGAFEELLQQKHQQLLIMDANAMQKAFQAIFAKPD